LWVCHCQSLQIFYTDSMTKVHLYCPFLECIVPMKYFCLKNDSNAPVSCISLPFHIIQSASKSRCSNFLEYFFEVNFQPDWSVHWHTDTITTDGLCRHAHTQRKRERERQTDRQTALYIRCGKAIDSDKPTTYYTLNLSMSLIKSVP
jgi:hypothetical protein